MFSVSHAVLCFYFWVTCAISLNSLLTRGLAGIQPVDVPGIENVSLLLKDNQIWISNIFCLKPLTFNRLM